ncbi:hypothetical protein BK007_02505 [Methanobacterium subterraneum]|uniref:Uncharacterized protein n=1 Tax=Methanobacterium subterraneum TaxID=59277 RepID=A0A2H4VA82_9EURY|nr:hypothetical protein [Methanobacterium subterraneum]AUB54999.1 hypothetical protein BK007_02505 [Methanobacterium subterraneum]
MNTVEVEVLRREAMEEEKEEIERIRKKYRERQKHGNQQNPIIYQEKQALIKKAQQQEQQEKEQLLKKYRERQKHGNQQNPIIDQEKQALIKKAQQQEQQEKEQLLKKYQQRKPQKSDPSTNYLENKDLPESNEELIVNDNLKEFRRGDRELKAEKIEWEEEISEELKLDRSALLAKYNLKNVNDDVEEILHRFDQSVYDEDVEKIERKLTDRITTSALSHPKVQWVNVLVFFNEGELEGNIKIFAEYADKGLLNRIRSENNERRLEFELIQAALYEVWDVFTTLGINIDDLDSKLDVEVELDRA